MTRETPSILLAAGGTGGHLFPAFALAEELQRRGYPIDLVTDMRGDRYGTGFPARSVYQLPSATPGSKRSPIALGRAGFTLLRGVRRARKLLRNLKPAAVIGFGGYPTIPPLVAARMLGIPSIIHEQNAVLGRANKVLARGAATVATSFRKTRYLDGPLAAKARFTGNPVRDLVIEAAKTPYPPLEPGGALKLLVFGGSQGARFFSEAVPPALATLPQDVRQRIKLVQQAREEDVTAVTAQLSAAGISSEIAPFFKGLPQVMADSHLVIARAGASSVAELAVIGRPSILVPLPHSLDSDQLENASNLAESGGSWCIEQKDLTPLRLATELGKLFDSPDTLITAAARAKAQGQASAVKLLADLVEDVVGRRRA
ncbi:undecaprenyldiphospho-muramoylpentapeptide beta-N-acetylglucosaminyltransferase [Hyphomicrobium sp.]|uniref:undecaprenyldiphospho-muramoylpentapeptide beta-N-acetylglucosaminyltransferase n=1 Tax=Hyphomicrobium sp. TaxID=82 RepID=UPI002E363636|nr:undecaprenyldiphospho-muramoylpentapeptide beta-N-acetylglucosaminyltransferase [Hyphomicrobium sp.]HEX2840099.1 undecaprenyldiphospho-muramoylpentapeptide beta-N-acetylglucosaminyltransferase [Hyphomicrobium sp.]